MAAITYIQAISDGLREEMQRDDSVFCLGQDIGVYGGAFGVTKDLITQFGEERVWDTPLSETAIIGNAIGAALYGMRPVAEMQFADFVACGFNQIVSNAAKIHYRWGPKVPMVVRLPWGGGVSGGPFHSGCMEAWFFNVPGLKLVCPSTPTDAKGLIKAAIRDDNPVLYFEHKHLYRLPKVKEEVPEGDYVTPIGTARIAREGKHATIITYGIMVHYSVEAAETLAKEGVEVEVIDLRSLRPFDKEAVLASVRKTSRAMLVTEATITGSITGEFAALISDAAFEHLDAPIKRVGALDTPIPYAPPLEQAMLPDVKKIETALRELLAY
ncbi:MAG: alpha-ketoacid dehydrogenase subunit beta [Planctomycetes bacterium]|nr:alpha-ketoacid dehydrogenase subunit beta [Planctomycetota bacterium]NUQ33928.1 alpha-ketoacid dehydrogenase subunit beta [Planctomycetaceae bacterium]